ncbi:MAG: pseudaminic acid biosynthesis-associated methylase, partial [Candidatus Eremiobacteraeota bacterium]|nr:pseudaminic acid biosynthesis-associated methylase [Candidatus Eremiobacteraeota bacterium]
EYAKRNAASAQVDAAHRAFFARVLQRAGPLDSVMEYGTNIGINLVALHEFLPNAEINGVELHAGAAVQARSNVPSATIYESSILEFEPPGTYDLVLIKGVLIHINPAELATVYELLHRSTKRFVCIAEYYSPKPAQIEYHGQKDRLFKRDFAGEMLDRFSDLALIDYGFFYHRDAYARQDDLTWFLLEKRV